jgi:hypothetical protein
MGVANINIVLFVNQSGSLPMGILHKNLQSTLNTK